MVTFLSTASGLDDGLFLVPKRHFSHLKFILNSSHFWIWYFRDFEWYSRCRIIKGPQFSRNFNYSSTILRVFLIAQFMKMNENCLKNERGGLCCTFRVLSWQLSPFTECIYLTAYCKIVDMTITQKPRSVIENTIWKWVWIFPPFFVFQMDDDEMDGGSPTTSFLNGSGGGLVDDLGSKGASGTALQVWPLVSSLFFLFKNPWITARTI